MKNALIFGILIILIGCEKNHAPVIHSIDCLPESRKPGTIFTLTVKATDPDGDPLKISWNADGGEFIDSSTVNQVRWRSPMDGSGKTYSIGVTVNDGSATASANYTINLAANHVPVITDLRSYPTSDVAGTEFVVKVVAQDPENDPLTYRWDCTEGEFTDGKDRSLARWLSPGRNQDTTYSLTLEVSDGIGKIDTILQIRVSKSPAGRLIGHTYYSGTKVPIAGVNLSLADKSTITDSTGWFEFNEIPPGTHFVDLTKTDFGSSGKDIVIAPGVTNETNFYLTSQRYSGRVFGVIKDQDGSIIEGARILMVNPDQTESEIQGTSDSQGNFELNHIPLGIWTFVLTKAPTQISLFETIRAEVNVSTLENPIDFTLKRVSLIPVVITQPVTRISYNFSVSGGDVTYDGNSQILKRGVCWSINSNPQISDNKTSNGTGTGKYESSLTGLVAGTSYYFRAYATNSMGNTGYGEVLFMTTLQNGSITDQRDQKIYKTVEIGSQTWMAENLNFTVSAGSWCYEDKNGNCTLLGHIYDYSGLTNAGSGKGVCPGGWHVPSDTEWALLIQYLGNNPAYQLKSISGWNNNGNGDNSSGFNAKPGGLRNGDGSYDSLNDVITFWSLSSILGRSKLVTLDKSSSQVFLTETATSNATAYVRCLKD